MYHDEFGPRPARRESFGEKALPTAAMEIGGGLWMALLVSLNHSISALVFQLGGMLPLFACSLTMLAHRTSEALARLSATGQVRPRLPVPIHHLGLRTPPVGVGRRRFARAESPRAGFDHSGRLG